ncbi:MAG: bifunctional fucokinase/L-fucose-1-P-guanylyltransferase, partial [Lachnospiraceae bacterium]|nr:bifunctional fucokinase/L-fucose-1-P-guanylyltransferase [Lachnospiraceae bacterium]
NVLRYIGEQEPNRPNPFRERRILVIHSGGDSKRVPQYSALGKLFSPVPRELPDGRASTLFDEFMIAMSGMPSRIREGMLVLSGDVLLLFNPLQIDSVFHGAAAISIKEPVSTGKNHGVFLGDGDGYVRNFLHKQTEERLREIGAVNEQGAVDLDTGAILMDAELLSALYGLIVTDGRLDESKFCAFVNEDARVSFYGDMLYPLAADSTLEQYYQEKPEGSYTEDLKECRTRLWEVLRRFRLKLFGLSPAQFIHFGTTRELRQLVAKDITDYEFLDWKGQVLSTKTKNTAFASYQSYIGQRAVIGENTYVEESYVLDEAKIGAGSVLSHVKLRGITVPENIVLHGLPLPGGRQVVRIYGVLDNPKGTLAENAAYLNTTLPQFMKNCCLQESDLWEAGKPQDIWNAKLFPVCDSQEEALAWALTIYELVSGQADGKGNGLPCGQSERCREWLSCERMSLCGSFNAADMQAVLEWQNSLGCRIVCRKFIDELEAGTYYKTALEVFGIRGITEENYKTLMEDAAQSAFSTRIRIYYAVSRYMKSAKITFGKESYDYPEGLCFRTIREAIYAEGVKNLPKLSDCRIAKERVDVQLPVRVNWGGGWTDTPPHCNEKGGVVLNAALSLNGILPIQVTVKRLPEYEIEFESQDIGVHGIFHSVEEIQDCHNPYDSFALHKAALIACGIIPPNQKADLKEILKALGGGIYLSTQVIGIPKGSGLGTSSILAAACVKGLYEFLGQEKPNSEIYGIVLNMEQIMSTGGGWQDQVGGLSGGVKFITTRPGMEQKIEVTEVAVPEEAMAELQERFVLIYTGQRRLARNLLRDVIGGYIGARPESLRALSEMQSVAALMRFALERGDIDRFASLLNKHWELSKQLDGGSTNTCIDQIFVACEDLIDGQFICGAGGGGFLMVILKKGVSKEKLKERLAEIFQNSGVGVWDSAFV